MNKTEKSYCFDAVGTTASLTASPKSFCRHGSVYAPDEVVARAQVESIVRGALAAEGKFLIGPLTIHIW